MAESKRKPANRPKVEVVPPTPSEALVFQEVRRMPQTKPDLYAFFGNANTNPTHTGWDKAKTNRHINAMRRHRLDILTGTAKRNKRKVDFLFHEERLPEVREGDYGDVELSPEVERRYREKTSAHLRREISEGTDSLRAETNHFASLGIVDPELLLQSFRGAPRLPEERRTRLALNLLRRHVQSGYRDLPTLITKLESKEKEVSKVKTSILEGIKQRSIIAVSESLQNRPDRYAGRSYSYLGGELYNTIAKVLDGPLLREDGGPISFSSFLTERGRSLYFAGTEFASGETAVMEAKRFLPSMDSEPETILKLDKLRNQQLFLKDQVDDKLNGLFNDVASGNLKGRCPGCRNR